MKHHFETWQWVPYPLETVFNFFADPRNLPPLMPRWQQAKLTRAHMVPPPAPPKGRSPTGSEAGEGSELRIRFRPFPGAPFRLTWDARIAEFAWDDHFCDVQVGGPLASWRHCHRLAPQQCGDQQGTRITDEVSLEFPLGAAGDLAWRLFGERQMESMFRFRQRQLVRLLRKRG